MNANLVIMQYVGKNCLVVICGCTKKDITCSVNDDEMASTSK